MDLVLVRAEFRPDGIFSELCDPAGNMIAVTLERAYYDPLSKGPVPKVPDGEYLCKRGVHKLAHMIHGFETFEVTGVPGHTNILFHVGNFSHDSEGCILLGANIAQISGQQAITQSAKTFMRFLDLQEGTNEFKLFVKSD